MLKFFGYFSDGAVIQRGEPVLVRGYADGETTCTLEGGRYRESVTVKAENGRFCAEFPAVAAADGEFLLTAVCGEERTRVRVRFGDVYLALGQSNMSYALSATERYEDWLKRAAKLPVSVLDPGERFSDSEGGILRPALPQEDLAPGCAWKAGGKALASVSALCVQTAVLLAERGGIPVGFVQTAMGGLSAETYMPRESAEGDAELISYLKETGRYVSAENYNRMGGRNYTQLSGVWNEKIAPLEGVRFKGIVWYLGESAAYDFRSGEMFLRLMKIIRKEYRRVFGDIPFVVVHIAPEYYPYGDGYGYLYINEALERLRREEENVLSVPVYDIEPRWRKPDGDVYFHPIHPVNKAPIAVRIADALDGTRTRCPEISEVRFEGNKAFCRVAFADGGLRPGRAEGFTLAGENGKYYPARAEVTGKESICVYSRDVPRPRKLTYAFMQYQDFCNVRSESGAPLLPWRSDCEAVDGRYFFPPAFTVNGALRVYENNFGWEAGTCRRAPVWKNGEIYDGADTEIVSEGDCVCVSAYPSAENYFFFGASPALCLSGHKNHLADYAFLNVRLKAEGKVTFWGVVFRFADGNVCKFDLMNGKAVVQSLPLSDAFGEYVIRLGRGIRGDSSPVVFSPARRKRIVEAEFLFRASEPVKVYLKDLTFSDRNFSAFRRQDFVSTETERKDMRLPERSDS